MSRPFSPMAQIPVSREAGGRACRVRSLQLAQILVSREAGGTRLSRLFSPMAQILVSREAGGTRLSRPFSPMAQIPVSREAGGRAMYPRRLGAWRWSEDPRRKFFTFGNQSRRDAENVEAPGFHHVANPSTCPVAASCDPPVGGVPCNFTFQRRAFGTYECSFDLQNNDPADCKGKSTVPVPKQNIVLYDPYHHMYGFPGINLLSRHMK